MKGLKIILSFVSILIGIIIFIDFYIAFAEIENPGLNELDPTIGRKRKMGLNYTMFTEGFSMGYFNNYGYIGSDYPYHKPSNTLRIALMGDSYVEGFQVFDRDHFRKIIEDQLQNCQNKKVEVLNFGRSGFDLADMYVYYQQFVKKFNPDIVLLFISNPDLKCTQTDPAIPRLNILADSLVISSDYYSEYHEHVLYRLQNNARVSRVFQMLNNCRKLIQNGFFLPKLLDKFYPTSIKAVSTKEDKKSQLSLDKSQLIIECLASEMNVQIWIVYRAEEKINLNFSDILMANKVPTIYTNDTLNALTSQGLDIHYWKATKKRGHWNQSAHKAIGAFISNKLKETNCSSSK